MMYGLPNGWNNFYRNSGALWVRQVNLPKKKKRKKKLDKQLEAMFGDDKPGFLQLMDDEYNANLKKILLVMLMEDDD